MAASLAMREARAVVVLALPPARPVRGHFRPPRNGPRITGSLSSARTPCCAQGIAISEAHPVSPKFPPGHGAAWES
eukprot:scaffold1741_cov262-Pinguiococcus_pyrenoidosus.AAC.26